MIWPGWSGLKWWMNFDAILLFAFTTLAGAVTVVKGNRFANLYATCLHMMLLRIGVDGHDFKFELSFGLNQLFLSSAD